MTTRYLAIALILSLVVSLGVFATLTTAMASDDTPTLQVKATPGSISIAESVQLQVQVQHATPSTTYAVNLEVSSTTTPPGIGGGPFCETASITTDAGGNGETTVSFPDGPFAGCTTTTPKGAGGPNTEVPGTYTVTAQATDVSLGSASTTFVVESLHEISGTGTIAGPSVINQYPGLQSGTGCLAHAENSIGSIMLTGPITTNTPGQKITYNVEANCLSPALGLPSPSMNGDPATNTIEIYIIYTLPDVTVSCTAPSTDLTTPPYTILCPPGGYSRTGSLTITETLSGSISSSYPNTGLPNLFVSVYGGQMNVVGSGGLAGLTGTGTVITVFGGATNYFVDLQVPGSSQR